MKDLTAHVSSGTLHNSFDRRSLVVGGLQLGVGVLLAALLFRFLYQGGGELALWTSVPRELIVVIEALVILFTGALDNMVRMPLERLFAMLRRRRKA